MDILYLSPADWDGARGRFQHIAMHLARTNRVLNADGLSVRRIGRRDWRRSYSKVRGSLRPAAKRIGREGELYRIVLLTVPGATAVAAALQPRTAPAVHFSPPEAKLFPGSGRVDILSAP